MSPAGGGPVLRHEGRRPPMPAQAAPRAFWLSK